MIFYIKIWFFIKVINLCYKTIFSILGKPFIVEVQNEREAYLVSETLANQHLFLFEGNFIPDYNIVNVEMWDEGQ